MLLSIPKYLIFSGHSLLITVNSKLSIDWFGLYYCSRSQYNPCTTPFISCSSDLGYINSALSSSTTI